MLIQIHTKALQSFYHQISQTKQPTNTAVITIITIIKNTPLYRFPGKKDILSDTAVSYYLSIFAPFHHGNSRFSHFPASSLHGSQALAIPLPRYPQLLQESSCFQGSGSFPNNLQMIHLISRYLHLPRFVKTNQVNHNIL